MLFTVVLLAAGIALRLLWLTRTPGGLTGFAGGGEAARVALALARTGTFGDAFAQGSGPTAHLMPVLPAIAAAVFRIAPPTSAAASLILLAWALAQTLGGILLLRLLFARMGASPGALRWATATLLLAPVFVQDEVIGFRFWDGAAAVCLGAAGLLAALSIERDGRLGLQRAAGAAALWALTVFVNPIAGFALALVLGWTAIRRLPRADAVRFALLSAATLALLLVSWTIRNARALGDPVVLRSNFGLELAIGNHPAALSDVAPEKVYLARLTELHPLYSGANRAAMARAGGEVPYARRLGAETWRWIGAHPLSFARLAARHLRQFLFPPAWLMITTGWEELTVPRAALVSLLNLCGLAAIAVAVARRRPGAALLAIYVAAVALPYALVQPVPRYTYLVWGLLAFAAWDGAARLAASLPGAAKPR